jgi:hypothetical protein
MTATEVEHRRSGAMPMPGRPRGQPDGGAVIGSPREPTYPRLAGAMGAVRREIVLPDPASSELVIA